MNAQRVIAGLVERGLPEHIAIGIAGNIAVESGFDPGINEISPLVPGSRGGFGLYQVTGPRRRQYEQFAQSRGARLDDVDAQLDFMVWELGNTEKSAAKKLTSARTPEDAARIFSESFLRPGKPHLSRRISEASKLAGNAGRSGLGGLPTYQPENTLAQGTSFNPQQNALAQPQLQYRANTLDPADFMNTVAPRNRLAFT